MSDRELFTYDVRVRERFLAEGTITKADVERHLAALPDAAANSEEVDLEQPALAKDIDDSAASATLVDSPALVSTEGAAAAGEMQRAAGIPAIAEAGAVGNTAAEPRPSDVTQPIPAVAQDSTAPAAPAEPHGPTSVPPPTASVDADWGDS